MPVYLATVRLLHRWIFGGEPGKNYPDALVDLVRKGRIGVSDYAPEEVAYALFRCTFESDRALTRRKNPYSLEELIESALRPKIHFNVKQHRLEIRIRLLAHYAECYAAVRSKVGVVREFPAFLGTQLYEKHLRPCGFCGMEKGGDFNERQNFLVFGTVPGLPLQPFKRTTCLDSPIVRLLRRYLDDGELRRQ